MWKVTEKSKARGRRMALPPTQNEKRRTLRIQRRDKNLHLVFPGPQQQLAKLNLIVAVVCIWNEKEMDKKSEYNVNPGYGRMGYKTTYCPNRASEVETPLFWKNIHIL
jgi:hypothetical protein